MRNVHSLNARDNGLLPWVFARSNSDPGRFRDNIQRDLDELVTMLRSRQVAYSDLKSALVPPQDGRQVVFLYDWLNDPSWNYAVEFSKHWLPVLRKTLRTSVKDGDLLPPYPAIRHLEYAVHRAGNREVRWDTQYAVYFSNLKTSDIELLHTELLTVDRYRGYIDVTYSSLVRNYLARCITFGKILHDGRVILSHGGDDPFISDEDPVGYPYAENGYQVVSLIDSYFLGFLDYKIESDDASEFHTDVSLSLASITGRLINLAEIKVFVPPSKLEKYLLLDETKLKLMTSIGLQNVTPDELAGVIRDRLQENYVYDLRIADDGVTPLFAVSAEFEKPDGMLTRRLLALKYDHAKGRIALVSMY